MYHPLRKVITKIFVVQLMRSSIFNEDIYGFNLASPIIAIKFIKLKKK